jgi:hypothetical protein
MQFLLPAALVACFSAAARTAGCSLQRLRRRRQRHSRRRHGPGQRRPSSVSRTARGRSDGFDRIDCAGNYLAPGLIDVHTHLENTAAMKRALDSGTTTVRSASVPAFQDIGLRELVRAGALPGPDVVAAGVYVTPDLEDGILADPRLAQPHGGAGEADLRLVVQVNAERGVDVIKTRGASVPP